MKKLERLIAMLYLLRRRRLRARDIARELGVTERTVYRDIASLNEAFQDYLRIVFLDDGYRLDSTAYVPPLRLTPEELAALRTAADAVPPTSPHAQRLKQAVSKILSAHAERAALPPYDEFLTITTPIARDRVSWRILNLLEDAIKEHAELDVRYFAFSTGQENEHLFSPYALTFRKHAWYLVGRCETHNQLHLLRASRIRQARRTGKKFERPADFSVEQFFAQSWQVFVGKPVTVKLHFSAHIAPLIEELEWHPSQRLQKRKDGSILFTAQLPLSPELTAWVLSWGADCEVLEPSELRQQIQAVVKAMGRVYDEIATDKD